MSSLDTGTSLLATAAATSSAAAEPAAEERRRTPRARLGRLATIKLGIGMDPRYVLVTNASEEGVRLQINGIEPRDEFVLLFHGNGGPARDGTYKLIWRHGQDVGAKYVSDVTQNV
jgi:hypothetical protein